MKRTTLCLVLVFMLLSISACTSTENKGERQLFTTSAKQGALRVLTQDGGRVAWSKTGHKIAFDRLGSDGWYDLWMMNTNGKHQKCVTCDHPVLPNKHIGQPAWHPSEEILVIQAQKAHVPRYADKQCTPGAGALNDLWIITPDGGKCWKLYTVKDEVSKDAAGVLHPHFSHDGKKLFWSERIRNNNRAFGEWLLKIADFYYDEEKGPRLGAIRSYNPGGKSSFFESHSFSPDDQYVLFTGNQDGPLEIYEMTVNSGDVKRLTHHSAMTWDEHAHYSPDGNKIVWMSSKEVRFELKPFLLQAEFWIMNRDGTQKRRLTWFNQPGHPQYLGGRFAVSADFDWRPDGRQIAGLVITGMPKTNKRGSGVIVMIDLPEAK